jgi:DNA-binding MarR family transcriptional regulator
MTQRQSAALMRELQRTGDGAVFFNRAVAARAGLPDTDLKVLSLLTRLGTLSAGRIAALTGLSSSAVTFMIDRLEKAGYARRVRHPNDRRSVLVELNREAIERDISAYFAEMEHATERVIERYSDAELAVILDFLTRANEAAEHVIAHLREEPDKPTRKLS